MRKKLSNVVSYLFKGGDLKAKAARSSAILSISTAFNRVLQLGRTMILARLLAPEEFGLVAMAMMVVAMVESITDAGVRLSIIQKKGGANYAYLNVAWWFQALRGLILFLIVGGCAPWIAIIYEKPQLVNLLRVSFLTILLNGLVSPRVHILEKQFQFGKWAAILQVSSVIGTAVTIGFAYYSPTVWAIVIGVVVERGVYCLISFILCPFKPSVPIDHKSLLEIIRFAKGIVGLSLMNLVARQADVIVLGKVVSESVLGIYYLAVKLAEQPMGIFGNVISRILLPAFAEKQDKTEDLQLAVMKVNLGTSIFGLSLSTMMASYAPVLLTVIYGQKYAPGAMALSILSFNFFVRMHIVILTQLFFACGFPHLHRRLSFIRFLMIISLIYPSAKFFGINGAASVLLGTNSILLLMQLITFKRIIKLYLIEYFRKWLPGALIAFIVLLPAIVLRSYGTEKIFLHAISACISYTIAFIVGTLYLRGRPSKNRAAHL